jgi:hypothetical protein
MIPAAQRPERPVLALLALLTLAVAWARFAGLDAMLPHQMEPDTYSVQQAEFLQRKAAWRAAGARGAAPQPEPHFYFYPMLLGRIVQAYGASPPAAAPQDEAHLREHLGAASRPLVRGRRVSALAALLFVPGTFLLARRFLGPWRALLAAAFAATSLLLAVYAGQARPHALASGTTLAALLAALHLRRHPTPWGYVLAGLAAGLAACSLQNGAVVLFACGAAVLLRDRDASRGGPWKVLAGIAVVAGLVLLLYPILIEPAAEGTQQSYAGARVEDGVFDGLGHRIDLGLFSPTALLRLPRIVFGYDPVLCVAALLGLAVALARCVGAERARRRDGWVVAAHGVPYALVVLVYTKSFDRYALPLLPALAVLAAAGAGALIARATRRLAPHRRAGARALGAALILALPAAGVLQLTRLRLAPDTYEVATRWVARRVEPGAQRIVVGPLVVLPLAHHPDAAAEALPNARGSRWLRYEASQPADARSAGGHDVVALDLRPGSEDAAWFADVEGGITYLRALDPPFVVLERSQRALSFRPAYRNLRQALNQIARPALLVGPRAARDDAELEFLDWGDAPDMLRRVLASERLGPRVEVWRLRPPPGAAEGDER